MKSSTRLEWDLMYPPKTVFSLYDMDLIFTNPLILKSLKYDGIQKLQILNILWNHLSSIKLKSFSILFHPTSKLFGSIRLNQTTLQKHFLNSSFFFKCVGTQLTIFNIICHIQNWCRVPTKTRSTTTFVLKPDEL